MLQLRLEQMSKLVRTLSALIALIAATKTMAVTCDDVKYVDQRNGYELALYTHLGCQPITNDLVRQFRGSPNPLVRYVFTTNFLVRPQPPQLSTEEFKKILKEAVKARDFYSIFLAQNWVSYLSSELLEELNYEQFSGGDEKQRDLAYALIAAKGLTEDGEFQWKLGEYETISALMNAQTIPYIADYLSYAYSNGIGVTKNFSEVERLSIFASQTVPEAKRYLAVEVMQFDFDRGIKLLEETIQTGYISAIEDYYYNLVDLADTVPGVREKINNLIPDLETLGYSGDKVAQRILGQLYSDGIFVGFNEERAVSWYQKSADQNDTTSADYLVKYYTRLGEFKKAAELLTVSAKNGYVWDEGYFALMHMIKLSRDSWPDAKKLLEYIKYHCINNQYVSSEDKEVCKRYPISDAAFEDIIPLKKAIADTEQLQYLDELKLPTGNYYALLIANQDYSDWEPLKTPIRDVGEIAAVLSSDYSFEVTKVTNASRNKILREIYSLGEKAEFNDHVLVYYAGHGLLDERTNEGYWIPTNADTSFRPDWVSNSEIKTALKSINSRHLLVMADSCYSGTLLRSGSAVDTNMPNSVLERLFLKKAKIAITSGGSEPVADSVNNGETSLFAKAFKTALNQNSGTFISASKVFSEIRDKVTKDTNQTPQYANMRELDDDGGEFVFRKVR